MINAANRQGEPAKSRVGAVLVLKAAAIMEESGEEWAQDAGKGLLLVVNLRNEEAKEASLLSTVGERLSRRAC
jgi:hypothetical protein